jgi:peptidoglycan/LPS O-acetylase OafA/YrhL
MHRIHKLDGLRGLCALFVVLFHLNKNNAPLFLVNNFFVRESHIFVDFFFILSGYVISLTYNQRIQQGKDFVQFLKKRVLRLYPLLLFSTGMYWYFVHPHFDKQNIRLALDTLLFTNSTPIFGTGIGMNYPSWSISSEMISYLFFGLSSLIAIDKRKPYLMGAIIIACFIFLGIQHNYFLTGDYGFVRGLACFNLGYFVFLLAEKPIQLSNILEGVMTLIIVGLMYLFHQNSLQNNPRMQWIQWLIPFAFASGILVLIKTNGYLSSILASKPLLFLGKISFSVYLNQALVIGYCIPKLYKWVQFTQGEMKKTICVMLLLTLLIIYSWGTQNLIERRLGKQLSKLTS